MPEEIPAKIQKIDATSFPTSIDATGHDFLTLEPVRDSRVYY